MRNDGNCKISLVAGGAGFLGSHLCLALLKLNKKVICIDNLSTGNINNIAQFKENESFFFYEHDIVEPLLNLEYFKELEKIDEIYNFACPASPRHYQADPLQTLKTSILGTINLLELAKKFNCKILQASTSEVYGDPHLSPQQENYWGNVNPVGKRSCYDEGKRCAETFLMEYNLKHSLETKIIRIFNTYGPGMDIEDGRVISNFMVQALRQDEITVYGTGEQTRSFCYVDDLIEGILKVMELPRAISGPINLGNPDTYTINSLALKVIEMTDSQSKIVYKELPEDDPKQRCPDISFAKEIINWQPKTFLEDGLKKTIEYFKKLLRINL